MEGNRFHLPVMGEKPAPPPADVAELPADASLEDRVVAVLKSIYDPELPVSIHELGLIYAIKITEGNEVEIRMTLTAPNCPVAGSLVGEVQKKVAGIPGVTGAKVDLVWDPPWDRSRMSEAAQLELGLF